VHALLEAGAVADEVQPPACALAFGAHARVGQPDRRHQIAVRELGEHQASMRSVLQAKGASPFALCASTISTCQPASSSRSCTNLAPFIDAIAARRRAVPLEPLTQAIKSVCARRCRTDADGRTLRTEQVESRRLRLSDGGPCGAARDA
jgi:hypothetical protein